MILNGEIDKGFFEDVVSELRCEHLIPFPDAGVEPGSPPLQADSLSSEPSGKPKNTGVGCHALLQGIFPAQGWNSRLLPWQAGSLPPCATWEALKRRRVLARTDSMSYREQARNKSMAVYLTRVAETQFLTVLYFITPLQRSTLPNPDLLFH